MKLNERFMVRPVSDSQAFDVTGVRAAFVEGVVIDLDRESVSTFAWLRQVVPELADRGPLELPGGAAYARRAGASIVIMKPTSPELVAALVRQLVWRQAPTGAIPHNHAGEREAWTPSDGGIFHCFPVFKPYASSSHPRSGSDAFPAGGHTARARADRGRMARNPELRQFKGSALAGPRREYITVQQRTPDRLVGVL